METRRSCRRVLAGIITISLVAAAIVCRSRGSDTSPAREKAGQTITVPSTWPMLGGTPGRNMVNTVDRFIPTDWDVKTGLNIKWSARLGTRAYGGPVIAGGKVFVGTNNQVPRDPKYIRLSKFQNGEDHRQPIDKGIVMCFKECNGEFLWQAVHDKLDDPVNDWPREGICSTPLVEGNRVYYVSNRCEVVCADVEGTAKKEAQFLWKYDMMRELNVFPHNASACSPVIAGDLVFIVTSNGIGEEHLKLPSPTAPSFIALNKHSGKLVWKDNSPGQDIMHGQWSHAAYAVIDGKPQVVFPGGDGWLRGFDPGTGTPSAGLSLGGLRARRAHLRFIRRGGLYRGCVSRARASADEAKSVGVQAKDAGRECS